MKTLFSFLIAAAVVYGASSRVKSLQPQRRHVVVTHAEAVEKKWPIVAALGSGRVLVAAYGDTVSGQTLAPESKISDAIAGNENLKMVVAFHPDVSANEMDRILFESGIERIEHPDLLPTHRLVRVSPEQIRLISDWDEVSRIFPASDTLASGSPVVGCPGPVTEVGPIANYVATVGNGWDGAGRGSADLTFSIGSTTDKLAADAVAETIDKVLAEWRRYANISFTRTSRTDATRNINFMFSSREHGDPYPFDGRGGVLGHTFYPAGVNPEPVAGDLHLDEEESWSLGGSPDLYSVLLHEVGHALGLGHADRGEAVMYPYYRRSTVLHADDIAALQQLYASAEEEGLALRFDAPSNTNAESLRLEGSVTGGRGAVRVTWKTGSVSGEAAGGRMWTIASVPLLPGSNTVEVTATDENGAEAKRSAAIYRTVATAGSQPPSQPTTPAQPTSPTQPATQEPSTPAPSGSADITRPQLSFTSPALTIVSTSASTMIIRGTARDGSGIREVTWRAGSRSGLATGTAAWSFELPLLVGDNSVIVEAVDNAGNAGWRSLTVTRR